MPNKSPSSTPITSLKHADRRANIPTEELRDFVADEERSPKTVLYPRDPSLDPQLVWKGKDEQDSQPLEVPAVPVYIQEKIQPQAIIENVRAQARAGAQAPQQMSLFADFNGIAFEELVDFYHHEQNWSNRMILGDSLLVMTSLAEKEGLKGRVQMIYLDPPYGIKFGSNWQVSTRKRDVKDGKAEDATRQPEQIKAFRDTWQLGIHSYLAYLRDRLVVARELLTESGSIFVQIGDENLHLVRCVLDEVFGSENFVGMISFQKTGFATSDLIPVITDYVLWYAKQKQVVKVRKLYTSLQFSEDEKFGSWDLASPGSGSTTFEFEFEEKRYHPGVNRHWKTTLEGLVRLVWADRLFSSTNSLRQKRLPTDFPWSELSNIWTDTIMGSFHEDKKYVVQTSPKVVQRCILMTTDPGDLVLDPTCGSGTTAYVAEQWGRRWITIDTSRVAIALARTRLMAGRFPYYLLADSPEGLRRETEASGHLPSPPSGEGLGVRGDVKKGFVYRRVPHVTLKSIANNEEIDEIHARWQEQLEPLRLRINQAAGADWQEWEVPRQLPEVGAQGLAPLLVEWWKLRRERQKEIDASIARRADTELLYDQPYEDNKRIRVSGPFTVESLSPHRVLSTDEERPASEIAGQQQPGPGQFEALILDNLRTAGVQNTKKGERLKFTRLEPYAGVWLHAAGEYVPQTPGVSSPQTPGVLETPGVWVRRVAITIGPEHGTVGPELIKEAAKEAVQGVGFDLLVVCGFAFDPHVSEEVKRYGKLTILPVRINPDLQMGGDLLKKTGSGNLFMVFGEPDIVLQNLPDGKMTATIRGLDVYDPTTGEIRSSSTDDIACWFIDTEYNGEAFFVRHAYFTGADEPYDKLKRALRAEIDEAAWSALYTTTSLPFPIPTTGQIAIKVINHYGDEVMKVFVV